jgi:hypothetical protein
LEHRKIELGDYPKAILIGAQIEFRRAGHAAVNISVTEKHVWKAKVWCWSTDTTIGQCDPGKLPDDLL